ncbi:LysE type translocator [Planctomycetes bacterium MalM25]|nr:LysE type translocator [Planctomycetes bacterium MalM25]
MLETLALIAPLMLSPGPANLAAFALGTRHGLTGMLRFLLGVLLVYGFVAFAVGWLSDSLLGRYESWRAVWQTLGGLFVIWLGVKFWRRPASDGSDGPPATGPTLIEGAALQLLNPKYPAVTLTVYSAELGAPWWMRATLLTLVGAAGLGLYASAGAATDRLATGSRATRRRDAACGLMLVLVGVWLIGRAWFATA